MGRVLTIYYFQQQITKKWKSPTLKWFSVQLAGSRMRISSDYITWTSTGRVITVTALTILKSNNTKLLEAREIVRRSDHMLR